MHTSSKETIFPKLLFTLFIKFIGYSSYLRVTVQQVWLPRVCRRVRESELVAESTASSGSKSELSGSQVKEVGVNGQLLSMESWSLLVHFNRSSAGVSHLVRWDSFCASSLAECFCSSVFAAHQGLVLGDGGNSIHSFSESDSSCVCWLLACPTSSAYTEGSLVVL